MHVIDERALWTARSRERSSVGHKQRRPAALNGPADFGFGERLAEGGGGGERVQDVAHGAEAHDEQALGHQRSFWPRRLAMKEDAEWSLGSPTMATRPPQAMTSSRSGTESAV